MGHSLLGGSRTRWGQWGKGGVREEQADTWTGSRRLGRKRVSLRVEVSPGPELGAPRERTRWEMGEGSGQAAPVALAVGRSGGAARVAGVALSWGPSGALLHTVWS